MIQYQKTDPLADQTLPWPNCYYGTMDPDVRLRLLERHEAAGEEPEKDAIRRKIFDMRYTCRKTRSETFYVDRFMRAWMEMSVSVTQGIGIFGPGPVRKKWEKHMEVLGIRSYRSAPDADRELLAMEWKAFFAQYIEISRTDKTYSSGIMGFGHLSDEKIARKLAADLEQITAGFPKTLGLAEEFLDFHACAEEVYRKTIG